jgi:hypothetical protein
MRGAYRFLAGLVAALVVVQAFAIAYAVAGLGHWVDEGGTLDKAAFEDENLSFDGVVGFMIHGINGMMLIPLVSLILLIVSFFAKVPKGVMWAGLLLLFVVIQVALGLAGHSVPIAGGIHGLNALIVFGLAIMAFMRSKTAPVATTGATAAGHPTHV